MQTISAVISVHNGEKYLNDCLTSVQWVDEVIVIDHDSTDNTAKIARKFTKHVYKQPNDPQNIDLQKNFGFQKAKSDWILSLDADERLSDELQEELRTVISSAAQYDGYEIPRKNIIFGKWIEHSLWWPDYQLRLFKKDSGKFIDQKVHQGITLTGTKGTLKHPIIHENYQSLSQYLQKMDRYTENEANSMIKDNVHMHWTDAIRMPTRDFLKTFFLQSGYKDGLHGLVLSTLQAFYAFLVFAKVWEKNGFKEETNKGFLLSLYQEWLILQKEISYWFFTSLLAHTKNPLHLIKYRFLRKRSTPKNS